MCPYITDERREFLSTWHLQMGAGDLTYRLQQQLKEFLETKGLSYQSIAECLGALEGAKFDLLERVAKPYEQQKLLDNGDVWPAYLTSGGVTHG